MLDGAQRYLDLIDLTLRQAMKSRDTRSDSLAIALDFVSIATRDEFSSPTSIDASPILDRPVLDGAGHSRSLYRGLTLYALNRAGRLPQQTLERLAERCATELNSFLNTPDAPMAAEGARVVGLAYDALALSCGEREASLSTRGRECLDKIAVRRQSDGRFLKTGSSDNPEPSWYHELALLHAVSTYAHASGNEVARQAMLHAAAYAADQIQPDHASSHAFALHAFLRVPQGVYLADMMLHAAGVQSPATMDTVSLLLLADVLHCMRRSKLGE